MTIRQAPSSNPFSCEGGFRYKLHIYEVQGVSLRYKLHIYEVQGASLENEVYLKDKRLHLLGTSCVNMVHVACFYVSSSLPHTHTHKHVHRVYATIMLVRRFCTWKPVGLLLVISNRVLDYYHGTTNGNNLYRARK